VGRNGGAITFPGTCTHVMCFAGDVLLYIMGFGVVRLMLTCSWMKKHVCKQDEAAWPWQRPFPAALMQKSKQIRPWPSRRAWLVSLNKDHFLIRYILMSILRRKHSLPQLHLHHPGKELSTMSSTLWSLSKIVGGLSARVYDRTGRCWLMLPP